MTERKVVNINEGWHFRQHGGSGDNVDSTWLEVAQFPTNIHLDLLKHGKIPDPFIQKNELLCSWVSTASWEYRTTFTHHDSASSSNLTHELVFDGLDTFATVILNGKEILKSDNMFISHRVDVWASIQHGENELRILFESAEVKAKEVQKKNPGHKWVCWNGDPSRLGVRKAQYHWGWDWGPMLNTCGPWRPIRLESYNARVADLWSLVDISPNNKRAEVKINTKIKSNGGSINLSSLKLKLKVDLDDGKNSHQESQVEVSPSGRSEATFIVPNPALWYPHGYGEQKMYTITATLLSGSTKLDKITKKIGLRKAEVIQQDDKHGTSFFFRINGVDVFCGGSNWIPGDSFTPRMDEKVYRRWLEAMVHGNQTMVRVWGGGIYEEDVFYDLCDELGILVWQDFLFGCGNYPAYKEILQSIEKEAVQNVRRLRNHPSVVIYAGNNEDYQLAESEKLTYNFADKNPENWLKTDFPARYIYEKLLPDVIANEGAGVVYHPGSPWKPGKKTSDPSAGDMHQWNVWHGTQEKYQIYETLGGRFNSEFGMEGFPHIQTIDTFLAGNTSERYQQSSTVDFHNKAAGHERRIATYLVENFRSVEDFEGYIHLSQLVQSEAMAYGYRGWRKQWGDERHCGGALVWQLNDCWPVISWSLIDYYGRKKPAYYTIARALRSLGCGIQREHWDWSESHAKPPQTTNWECWVTSSKLEEIKGKLEIRFVSIKTGKDVKQKITVDDLAITLNGTTFKIRSGSINNVGEEAHVLSATLFVDGKVMARDIDWPQPLKYIYHSFEGRGLKVSFELPDDKDAKGKITVTCEKPVKGLVWEERSGVRVSDSAIDLIPGETVEVGIYGLIKGDKELSWRYLGM